MVYNKRVYYLKFHFFEIFFLEFVFSFSVPRMFLSRHPCNDFSFFVLFICIYFYIFYYKNKQTYLIIKSIPKIQFITLQLNLTFGVSFNTIVDKLQTLPKVQNQMPCGRSGQRQSHANKLCNIYPFMYHNY